MRHSYIYNSVLAIFLLCSTTFFYSCKTDDEPDWDEVATSDDSSDDQASADTTVFYESFNQLNGYGGNDGYFDNDDAAGIEIAKEDLTDASLLDNNSGWGDFVKLGICDKCIRIATKKKSGSITTPAIAVNGKQGILTFCAAAQEGDDVTLLVSVSDGYLTYEDTTAQTISLKLPATNSNTSLANQVYTMQLTGVSGSCSVTFATVSSMDNKQRAFLDEVKVVVN